MANSREEILGVIRQNQPAEFALPSGPGDWIEYADPLAHFCATLDTIGGVAVVVDSVDEINDRLAEVQIYSEATSVVSLVPGVAESMLDPESVERPHELSGLELAILPGELAVAENGAVWISDATIKHRAAYFICEHLVLVVPAGAVVSNMHQAYQRLRVPADGGHGAKQAFGCFISGPSKTADIEQSLVIGAQGARSTAVFLVRNSD